MRNPPWVGNPFPTLLATLNITCGREIPAVGGESVPHPS